MMGGVICLTDKRFPALANGLGCAMNTSANAIHVGHTGTIASSMSRWPLPQSMRKVFVYCPIITANRHGDSVKTVGVGLLPWSWFFSSTSHDDEGMILMRRTDDGPRREVLWVMENFCRRW